MTMTISDIADLMDEKVKHRVPVTPAELGYWSNVIRRLLIEVGDGRVLKTPGEVDAWFAGFAACSGRDVPDEMVDRASKAYNATLFTSAATHEQAMKAALVAALGE